MDVVNQTTRADEYRAAPSVNPLDPNTIGSDRTRLYDNLRLEQGRLQERIAAIRAEQDRFGAYLHDAEAALGAVHAALASLDSDGPRAIEAVPTERWGNR